MFICAVVIRAFLTRVVMFFNFLLVEQYLPKKGDRETEPSTHICTPNYSADFPFKEPTLVLLPSF